MNRSLVLAIHTKGYRMLQPDSANELAQIAKEAGALVLHGQLKYPGPETGDWEIGSENIPDLLYELRGRQMLLILAPVDDSESVHLCGICGFVLSKPGEPCARCALVNEDVAATLDNRRVAESVEDWLKIQKQPHPLEAELEKIEAALDALEACPPLWWTDKLLWRSLRWFYRMRQRRVGEALKK